MKQLQLLEFEIPEDLYESLAVFLANNSQWSQADVAQAAISLFLLCSNDRSENVSETYAQSLFK